ncbi:SLAP domain-containing protein [Heliophilum fasciatum]|uniref:SLAP domain-containing protein n=1 Tax=Heliophilum fasciatum TaxID=35700 RepID=A0A4R2RQ87_9FIRM|nr:SLAP domain-containing protein [Heliophilum fasciatum]MCW2277451.1 SLAP domain-containing protein [Heliophilum fasciatum]TCP65258.1 SLAP domain-containing protein [Heliophilum fasciatum]
MSESNQEPQAVASASPTPETGRIYLRDTQLTDNGDQVQAVLTLENTLTMPLIAVKLPVSLLDAEGTAHYQTIIDLSSLGTVPPKGQLSGTVSFPWEDKPSAITSMEGWQMVVDTARLSEVDVKTSFYVYDPDELLTSKGKTSVELQLARLQPPQPGEMRVISLTAEMYEGALLVRLLLCNSTGQEIRLPELPVVIIDKLNRQIAAGSLVAEQLQIPPYAARVIGTAFPPEAILVPEPNLEQWSVVLPKQ